MAQNRNWTSIYLTANTEEKLNQNVNYLYNTYLKDNPKINISLAELLLKRRYGNRLLIDDKYMTQFDQVNYLLKERGNKIINLIQHNENYIDTDGIQEIQIQLNRKIEHIVIKTMAKLDTKRVFEATNTRENIVLSVFGNGTLDDELKSASILNPSTVYRDFVAGIQHNIDLGRLLNPKIFSSKNSV